PAARRLARARSTDRLCTVTPNWSATAAASWAEDGTGSAAACCSRKSSTTAVSLCPPLVPGQAERRGGGARVQRAGLDRAHHLVLDLDQVGGIEEGSGGEGRIGHRLR